MPKRELGFGKVVRAGQRVSEANLDMLRGPRATGASQGVGEGGSERGVGSRTCARPRKGEQCGWERAVSRLWVCAPSTLQVTFTPVLFFKMEGTLGLDFNCYPYTPGRVCDPVLFGKPMLLSFPFMCNYGWIISCALLRFSFLPLGLRRRRHI